MWFPIPRRDDGVFWFCMASRDWYLSSRWSASSWLAEPGGWNKCHNLSCFLQNFKDRFYILIPTSFLRARQAEILVHLKTIFSCLVRSNPSSCMHGKGNKISLRSTNVFPRNFSFPANYFPAGFRSAAVLQCCSSREAISIP